MGKIVGRLRQARLDYQSRIGRAVSTEEIADAVGISRQALSEMETGKRLPRYKTLAALCKFYGKQPGDLLVYEDRSARPAATAGHLTAGRVD